MLKKLVILFVALALVQGVHAFEMSAQSDTIIVPTAVEREIEVTINSDNTDRIVFSLIDAKPWVIMDRSFVEVSEEPEKVKIIASPPISTPLGTYKITLTAESLNTKEVKTKNIFITVKKGEIVDIERVIVTGNLQPTGEVTVGYTIKNFRTATAEDILIQSTITSPSGKIITLESVLPRLDPGETKTLEKSFTLDKNTEAGDYKIETELTYLADKSNVARSFFVARKSIIKEEKQTFSTLFGYETVITIRNEGNTPASNIEITDILSGLEATFFTGNPTEIDNEKYKWAVTGLAVGDERAISYTVNYSSLYIFIVAIILLSYVYFFRIRIIRIKKHVLQKKHIKEGDEFTIGVEVKNHSRGKIDEVLVEDFVPAMFSFKHGAGPKPVVRKSSVGTELTWKLSGLHKGEVKLVNYKIIPAFGVHGKIRLPRVSIKYKSRNKIVKNHSTLTHIGINVATAKSGILKRF